MITRKYKVVSLIIITISVFFLIGLAYTFYIGETKPRNDAKVAQQKATEKRIAEEKAKSAEAQAKMEEEERQRKEAEAQENGMAFDPTTETAQNEIKKTTGHTSDNWDEFVARYTKSAEDGTLMDDQKLTFEILQDAINRSDWDVAKFGSKVALPFTTGTSMKEENLFSKDSPVLEAFNTMKGETVNEEWTWDFYILNPQKDSHMAIKGNIDYSEGGVGILYYNDNFQFTNIKYLLSGTDYKLYDEVVFTTFDWDALPALHIYYDEGEWVTVEVLAQ